jgi:antirestriction protein ArdC
MRPLENAAAFQRRDSVVKRDLYAEVSTRIIAELERGAAPWVKPWSATAGQNVPQNTVTNRPYSGCNVVLLWLARDRGWQTPRFPTFKQAIEAGGNVRRGEHGTKVYFVKQLQIKDEDGEVTETRLVPMLREYTVFNVDQCDQLPDTIKAAILTRGMRSPTSSCVQRVPTSVRGMAKRITCPAAILFRCRPSKRSREPTTSTTLSSMS